MSDYQWTEKEINKFIEKYRNVKGWLNARGVRFNPHVKVSDLRQLMKIAVVRGIAFDNETSPNSDRYKICFNLAEKEKIIEELYDSISYSPFEDLEMINMFMDRFISTHLYPSIETPQQLFVYINLHVEWFYILAGLYSHQRGENIEKICFEDLLPPLIKDSEDSEEFDRNTIKDFPPFISSYNSKDLNKHILIKIYTFINMYKALKVGWKEIDHLYPNQTYNILFITLLFHYYSDKFTRQYNLQKPYHKINIEKITTIKDFDNFIICQLNRLIEDENSDKLQQEQYKSTLEEYCREPNGQGLDKALDVLKEVSKKDVYIWGGLKNYYESLSMLGSYPNLKSFDDFLKSSDPGDFYFRDDIKFTHHAIFYQAVEIKTILMNSPNPRVRKAVSEWIAADRKIIALTKTRHERKPKKSKNLKKEANS
jgi:hypothetical protein